MSDSLDQTESEDFDRILARFHLELDHGTDPRAILRDYEARYPDRAKEFRDAREEWDGHSPLTVSWDIDNGNQTVTKTFHPPFTPVDREADYARAWAVFEERYG